METSYSPLPFGGEEMGVRGGEERRAGTKVMNFATWATNYPKPGAAGGTILVKGTTGMDPGWTPTSGLIVAWPVGGGPQTTQR
jgi:hypothetical protein